MSSIPGNEVNFDVEPLQLDEEGLFARDVDGQLIRVDKATAAQLDEDITLNIDGKSVTVKKAVPTRDSQGNILRDADGNVIPRPTTIYDASSQLFVREPGDENPIPTLCHQEHLPPIGVCRVCVVEAFEEGGRRPRLVPSCIQRVSDKMTVHTVNSQEDPDAANRVRAAGQTIVQLLMADHLPKDQREAPGNELADVARKLCVVDTPFESRTLDRGSDLSSYLIDVNHDDCILCGRCQRGCSWVKKNNVIGRGGKGYESHIAFDLDDDMALSSCVSCGECAVSCPTGALEFDKTFLDTQYHRVEGEMIDESVDGEVVRAEELIKYPLFSGLPYKFLQFNGAAVVRRRLQPGDYLCRQGEHGSTAFIILDGEFEVFLDNQRGKVESKPKGLWGWLGFSSSLKKDERSRARLADVGAATLEEDQRILLDKDHVILGEMTCMNNYPRSATVVATKPAEVLEVKRNVLFMLQRNAVSREILDAAYRKHRLGDQLDSLKIFANLTPEARTKASDFLRGRGDVIWVDPGQTIFRQDDLADGYYIIKLGFVKVTQRYGRGERVLNYIGPGNGFGEIGLLSGNDDLFPDMADGVQGRRTATCSALDHVELIRIESSDFRETDRECSRAS